MKSALLASMLIQSYLMAQVAAPVPVTGNTSLSGTILADDGTPAAGATLLYTKWPVYTRGGPLGSMQLLDAGFGKSVTVGSSGAFSVSGLPAGNYFLCATPAQTTQVSDCRWDTIGMIALSGTQQLTGLVRHVHEATALNIVANDPNSEIQLPGAYGNVAPVHRFFVGVVSGGIYVNAPLISSTAVQKTYSVLLPQGRSAQLFIDTQFTVTDANGNPVQVRQPTTLTVQGTSAAPVTVLLNVN
jgi:hypothetical protein